MEHEAFWPVVVLMAILSLAVLVIPLASCLVWRWDARAVRVARRQPTLEVRRD